MEVQIARLLAELATQLTITQVVIFLVVLVVGGAVIQQYRTGQQNSKTINDHNSLLNKSLQNDNDSTQKWAEIVTAVNTNNITNTQLLVKSMDNQADVLRDTTNVLRQLASQITMMDARVLGNTAAIDDIAQMMVEGQGSVERALQKGFEGVTEDLRTLQTLTKEYELAAKVRHASVEAQVGAHDEQYQALTEQLSKMVTQIFELSDTVTRILRDNKLHEQASEPIDTIDDDTQTGVPNNGS